MIKGRIERKLWALKSIFYGTGWRLALRKNSELYELGAREDIG